MDAFPFPPQEFELDIKLDSVDWDRIFSFEFQDFRIKHVPNRRKTGFFLQSNMNLRNESRKLEMKLEAYSGIF